ncbi:PREDICTED: pentatricopeptide repeat-containing protein At5g66520-like [Nicotiana attenuata]|uniref:Pentatricopeptide repeat-containing protein n=1 Tax=Nicotiana attenuata TaxID=49451 RepID=A0A314KVI9_NICAT|nr:PREDICTED: pentatricopeptide repeat-containing protein At5g66520-like [Nicotiana attenuata]OIT32789.1 pentatricopeptide repeat-containing protein [Nicotiana attenuata]
MLPMVQSVCLASSLPNHYHTHLSPKLKRSFDAKNNVQIPTSETLYNFNSPFELKQVVAFLIKTNKPLSLLPLPRVASVCALTPNFSFAQQIFNCIEQPEVSVWNSCLRNLAEGNCVTNAIFLFHQMRIYNVVPDIFTCSFVLKACVKLLDLSCGKIVHAYIEKLGFQSNLVLLNALLHLYATCGAMADSMLLFDKMPQRDVVSWNIMITQLAKKGDIDEAFELFSQMPERNLRSWTAMITGFVHCGKAKEAVRLFKEMEESGLSANEVTVVAVLAACADLGALELGRRIHEYSNKSGFKRNVHVCNTLIDMYIKCGFLEAAKAVFEEMKERTIVSWSAMIQGLAMHGQADEALELFNNMIKTGMKPNEVTFLGVLHACSHMGLVNEGREFFASMTRDYNITPQIEHYGCMVDLLSRAGLLKEAYEFIVSMPIKPNGVIWGSFLGGCRIQKDVEMAEEAMRHLGILDPLNDGYYIIMSNIYAEAKRWEDAARVRKLMKDRGVKKTPGWSSITIAGVMHEFVAGDDNHPQAEEIFEIWDKLLEQMRFKGYVPNTSVVLLDMEENEKEKYLYRHSEKLALVFGLMNTKPGETIRIMKNLRVCEDCHAAFKVISEIVKREIVVRDRNRFHCFKDGLCSCKDYW